MNTYKITIHTTNNPRILKFEANQFLVQFESYEFDNIDAAKKSPIAQQLFYLPFVKKVYISGNFIAIERYDIVEWTDVQNEVAIQIEEYLNHGGIIMQEERQKRMAVTVYSESTPNPNVLKFVANKKLVSGACEFNSVEEAVVSPFATALYQFPFVQSVFLDKNYVSITKHNTTEWDSITFELRSFIKSYIEEQKEIISKTAAQTLEHTSPQLDHYYNTLDDTSKEIYNLLEEHIKPAVASDGGNIALESYNPETKVVKVILQGACSGCPSSSLTLKNGIEALLKDSMGSKISRVEAVNG